MNLLRYGVISLVIFAGLVTMLVNFNTAMNDTYDLVDVHLIENKSVMQSLNELNIITSVNKTVTGFRDMNKPTSTAFDVLGGLASSALGLAQIIGSIVTTPFEIFHIVGNYYSIPPVLIIMLDVIVILFVVFIIASAYLRGDL